MHDHRCPLCEKDYDCAVSDLKCFRGFVICKSCRWRKKILPVIGWLLLFGASAMALILDGK